MKGVIEIEFIISVFVFITTISFVTFIIVNGIPAYHNTAIGENLKSMSYQYAEMLLFDGGYPLNWSLAAEPTGNVKRIGLSAGKRYVIDQNKLNRLASICNNGVTSNYTTVKKILGVDFMHDVVIEVSRLDGSPVVGTSSVLCGPPVTTSLRQQFQFTRLAMLPTRELVRLKVIIIT
jgi:hypothetical protein